MNEVFGTLGLLIEFYSRGFFGLYEALQYLKKINEVMYLSSDVYCYVEKKIKELTKTD